jgi:hypothetical protein
VDYNALKKLKKVKVPMYFCKGKGLSSNHERFQTMEKYIENNAKGLLSLVTQN